MTSASASDLIAGKFRVVCKGNEMSSGKALVVTTFLDC